MTPSIDASNLEAMREAVAYQAAMRHLVGSTLPMTGTILDFGAGEGGYAQALAAEHPASVVCALEPDPALTAQYPSAIPWVAELSQIPLGSLSGVYSLNVLEHIDDDIAALSAIRPRLAPSGAVFVLVPAHRYLWTAMDAAVGHRRRYSAQGLAQVAHAAGYQILASGWFDRTGYLASLATKVLEALGLPITKAGRISAGQVKAFDRVFSWLEPVLRLLPCLPGKNRWIYLQPISATKLDTAKCI